MNFEGSGKRVRIYIGEQDKPEGRHDPLWQAILNYLHDHGAAGATVFRALAGFGAHNHIHMARLADLVPDLPMVVEWIDTAERVDELLPHIRQMVRSGTITSEDVDILA